MLLNKEPCLEFKDDAELNKYLKEWQRILFLEDWIIKATLVDRAELVTADGDELVANNSFVIENKCASIKIAIPDDDLRSRIMKYCAELNLVHELLHCKRNWLQAPGTAEGIFWDTIHHQSLEEEARSYLLARYPIRKEWFSNIG